MAAVREHAPDVVLMDLVMPGVDGVEAIRRISAERPATRVIALTSFLDDDKVLPGRARRRGGLPAQGRRAAGPRARHPDGARRPGAAPPGRGRAGAGGGRGAGAAAAARRPPADPGLTPREREVLGLLARGMANKRIAQELGISEKTVKIHVSRVLHKLGVADRTQAALHAVKAGLA